MYIKTQRLMIRPLEPTDWQEFARIARDFAASPYAKYDHPMPAQDEQIQALVRHFV